MESGIRKTTLIAGWLGGSLVTALMLTAFWARADGDPKTHDVPLYIPYQGYLEKDGEPVHADVEVTFTLWDGDAARFTERRTVSVFDGRFTALVGDHDAASTAALQAALEASDALELEVTLHDGGDVVLDGRKPISTAPYAMLTGTGPSPTIHGQMVIEADLVIPDDGSVAPFVLTDGDGARLVMDGDEVNSDGPLGLNAGTDTGAYLAGDLVVDGGVLKLKTPGGTLVEVARANTSGQLVLNYGGGLASLYQNGVVYFEGDVSGLSASLTVDGDDCETFDLTASGEVTQNCSYGYAWTGGAFDGLQNTIGSKAIEQMTCCKIGVVTVK